MGTLGSYHVLRQLGRGGMGIVLLADDPQLQRAVALKVLRPDRADEMTRTRFVREAQAAAGIAHERVVSVYAVANPLDGPPFLVMHYVNGPTLGERIRAAVRLAPREAAQICLQVAEGLTAAHRAGLVHRHVKPANILLDSATGQAKITDFGLARKAAQSPGITHSPILVGAARPQLPTTSASHTARPAGSGCCHSGQSRSPDSTRSA